MKASALIFLLIFPLALAHGPSVWAQSEVEIEGLIIDQTRSKMGHDFYQEFVTSWEDPPGVRAYNIVIGEQNDPRLGNWVVLEIGDSVYRALLKPRAEDIAQAASEAIAATRDYLLNLAENEKSLEEKDMKGKGIY
jgi:curli production assembly/transport component CsgE